MKFFILMVQLLQNCASVIIKMFKLLVVSAFVAIATAAPKDGPEIAILRNEQNIAPDGSSYQWAYETENGINAQEQAELKATGPEEGTINAQGSFSFTSPEGEKVEITYVADENGFQPQGSHIPVAPPIPPQIQKALEWIAAHPEPETKQRLYETANGIKAEEQAELKATGPEDGTKNAKGSFSFTSPEGEKVDLTYTADENGYQPQGSHVPPIPPIIQKALDWIAAHPEPEGKKY